MKKIDFNHLLRSCELIKQEDVIKIAELENGDILSFVSRVTDGVVRYQVMRKDKEIYLIGEHGSMYEIPNHLVILAKDRMTCMIVCENRAQETVFWPKEKISVFRNTA